MLNNLTTECNYSSEKLIAHIRDACKDLADFRPDLIEMRPDYYNFIKANSEYIENAKIGFTPYYYGIRIEVKKDLDKPFRIIRGGEEVDE